MNILFIGKFLPRHLLKDVYKDSKGKIGMSNHNFEMSIINGLCQHTDIKLNCISIPEVYSFPYNNRRFYTKPESYDYKSTHIRSVGFCNLPIIKELWSTISLIFVLIASIYRSHGNRVDVIINTPNNELFNALKVAKIFTRKKITMTTIIPDIPAMVFSMDKSNGIKSLFLSLRNRDAMNSTSKSNGLVLLTKSMMDFVNKPLPYIVMEGVADINTMDINEDFLSHNKEIILYTGTLRKIFGIINLVEAFKMICSNDVELWICGSGDAKDIIEDEAQKDSRIKYFGLVDSQTALKMQHQATILVNPRTSDGEYTKYSFPSKTIEYLLSGKSVIINRLDGIPDEYYEYVFTPTDESVQSLYECLSYVLNCDVKHRHMKSISGRQFILEKKNSLVQTSRILEMIRTY